jgi:hypothetical protein
MRLTPDRPVRMNGGLAYCSTDDFRAMRSSRIRECFADLSLVEIDLPVLNHSRVILIV